MDKKVKLSELNVGDFFYNEELGMVCLVFIKVENCQIWSLSTNGDTHFSDIKSYYGNKEVIHIEDREDWTEVYDEYSCFDKDIRDTMLKFLSTSQTKQELESERYELDEKIRLKKNEEEKITSYLERKFKAYENVKNIEDNLKRAKSKLNMTYECEG